jgi:hypothetical protein
MVKIVNFRVKGEIQDSLIFKSDEKTLKHIEKLKEENQDVKIILNWVEEYSTLNINQDMSNTLKKANFNSNQMNIEIPTFKINSYESNYFSNDKVEFLDFNTNTENESFLNYNSRLSYLSNNNFINFSETCTIDDYRFDIFELEKVVGKENTLSTVSCFIFLNMNLYSKISYTNFENFIELIRRGYSRENSYHTDLHAADVEQTCYTFFKYGGLKEALNLTDLDCASFLIAAIIHDFKHPGLTNNFLINSKNEIATRYNGI